MKRRRPYRRTSRPSGRYCTRCGKELQLYEKCPVCGTCRRIAVVRAYWRNVNKSPEQVEADRRARSGWFV